MKASLAAASLLCVINAIYDVHLTSALFVTVFQPLHSAKFAGTPLLRQLILLRGSESIVAQLHGCILDLQQGESNLSQH